MPRPPEERAGMAPNDANRVSRRRLLHGAAVAASGGALSAPATADGPELSVMTRNLYVGVDLFRLFEADDRAGLRAVAGELLADLREHPFSARLDAIAGEIAAVGPDVVCLQEAALVRTRNPSEFDAVDDPGASEVLADLLSGLSAALSARGAAYEPRATLVTNDVEVPADGEDGPIDLRLTDRVAVLVRADLPTDASVATRFDAGVPVPIEDVDFAVRRGYAGADVAVGGRTARAVTTHLEPLSAPIRRAQAEELLGALPDDRPVAVGGDLNSVPGEDTYDLLRSDLGDAGAAAGGGSAGPTCCQEANLRNEASSLSRRVDAVLHRGAGRSTAVERVGEAPGDRVTADVDGETVRVWPSDHAGVVASLSLPAVPAATASPTARTPSPTAADGTTPTGTPEESTPPASPEPQPGMGLLAALLAGGAAVGARLWGRCED